MKCKDRILQTYYLEDWKMKVRFCSYCGKELDEGARFCKNCGLPVIRADNDETTTADAREEVRREEPKEEKIPDTEYRGNPTERKTVYEGEMHKCPNCGEIINSFTPFCPTCGYEIRDSRSSNSVRELAAKLEKISAREPPQTTAKVSVMKVLFGRDFRNEEEKDEITRFEENRDEEKVSLITNFPIPNTKEDIMEFMLLASSNIESESGRVKAAWKSKLKQVYSKAQIMMGDQPEFEKIEKIYKKDKRKSFWHEWGIVIVFLIFFIIWWISTKVNLWIS